MIVDDESYNCEVLKSVLLFLNPDFEGKLDICMSGAEALEVLVRSIKLKHGKPCSDIGLILTDLSMPMMDGY